MKLHTIMGARLFSEKYSEFDEAAAIVALNHHEKWDGTGYPGNVNASDGKVIPGYEKSDGSPDSARMLRSSGRLRAGSASRC